MPNINDMRNSKYLKKEDAGDGKAATIKDIRQINVAMENQPPEYKWVLFFEEHPKGLVMNQGNITKCSRLCESEDTDDWTGKKVTLYNDPDVTYGGRAVGGVRIREWREGDEVLSPPPMPNDDDLPF